MREQLDDMRTPVKYFLSKKIPFCLSDFAKHLEKPFILTKQSYGSVSNLRFATIVKNLKIIFSFQFSQYF